MPKKGKATKTKIMKQSQKVNIYLDRNIGKKKRATTRKAPGQTIKRGSTPTIFSVNVPQQQQPQINKDAMSYFSTELGKVRQEQKTQYDSILGAMKATQKQEDQREAKQVEAQIIPKIVAEPEELKAVIPQQQEPDIKREIPTKQAMERKIPKATQKPPNIPAFQKNELTKEFQQTLEAQEIATKVKRAQDVMKALEETRNIIKDTKAKKKEVESEAIPKAKELNRSKTQFLFEAGRDRQLYLARLEARKKKEQQGQRVEEEEPYAVSFYNPPKQPKGGAREGAGRPKN